MRGGEGVWWSSHAQSFLVAAGGALTKCGSNSLGGLPPFALLNPPARVSCCPVHLARTELATVRVLG